MINRVVLVGRLTKDPELRTTPNGAFVGSFTLAVDDRMKTSNGERTTSFLPCIVWNQQAENVNKYVRKGSLVGVEGRLNQRTYKNNSGNTMQVIEVICDSVQFLEPKKQDQNNNVQQSNNNDSFYNDGLYIDEDDLPF